MPVPEEKKAKESGDALQTGRVGFSLKIFLIYVIYLYYIIEGIKV